MLKSSLFCVWLIPANPYYSDFLNQIQVFANTLGAPVFTPHVTLFCGKTDDIEKTKIHLSHYVEKQKPFALMTESVEADKHYYKTLYIKLEANKTATTIHEALKKTLDPQSEYQFSPHLSLLYKDMPLDEKQNLIKKVLPTQEILFDQIYLVSDSKEENANAVKSWKILSEYRLK